MRVTVASASACLVLVCASLSCGVRPSEKTNVGPPGVDSLPFEYSATTRLVPVHSGVKGQAIEVVVRAVHKGREPVSVQYGDCAVELVGYGPGSSESMPVWRSTHSAPWPGGYHRVCLLYAARTVVIPGGTLQPKEFTRSFPVAELLADSLPDGEYRFAARVRLNSTETREIPAGRLRLSMVRGDLPSSRLLGVFTYTAMPVVAGDGGSLAFKGAATVTHAGGVLYRFAPACSMEVLAYQSRSARDRLPPTRESWRTPARACGPVIQTGLQCGETQPFESSATAREILGDSLPAGEYYFAVVLRDAERAVRLAAGSARLTASRATPGVAPEGSPDDSAVRRQTEERCFGRRTPTPRR